MASFSLVGHWGWTQDGVGNAGGRCALEAEVVAALQEVVPVRLEH